MEIRFNENLAELPTLDYRDMNELQGDLKTLEKENFTRLQNTLVDDGQLAPFYLWFDSKEGKYWIVDGHQRKSIFMFNRITPYERPYILIPGENINEAKKALLEISSQYGTVTEEGFNKFTFDFPKEWLKDTIHFDALSKKFDEQKKESTKTITFNVKESENLFFLNIECTDEKHAQELFEKLSKEGLKVKIVT